MIEGELGSFLRSRREALSPKQVGLPEGERRRAAGLRRSEVATLADVSVDYLTRLEQGRDHRPSSSVLAALADALQLEDDDRRHLFELAAITNGTELLCEQERARRDVRPSLQATLDHLTSTPAYVVDQLANLVTWNRAYELFANPLGVFDSTEPNLLQWTFLDARARNAYVDWRHVADDEVAYLHRFRRGDVEVDELAHRLIEAVGDEFAARWRRLPLNGQVSGERRLLHPLLGSVSLAFETLLPLDAGQQRLVIYTPADEETAAALTKMIG